MSGSASRATSLVLAAALAGCTLGPDFKPPVADAPAAWGTEPRDTPSRTDAGAVDPAWWRRFDDPTLSALVERLARQNLDLQAAAERIEQFQAQRRVVASQGLPHLDVEGSYARTRQSRNGTLALIEPTPGAPLEYDLFQDMTTASWELDLFGRVRRAVEAADATTRAAVEARHGLALAAIADLVASYMQLRGVQAREAITRRNISLAGRRKALIRIQRADGVATELDVANADAQAATIAEHLPALRAAEAQVINAIGLLLAQPPRSLAAELAPTERAPRVAPSVPLGLPADLLRRRPDVREAEARLHAATAQTGVAVAAFFPDVTLNADVGTQSLNTSGLALYASRAFMAGPSVSLPIFEGGRLRATLKLKRSQQREAALAYRQVVLEAFRDVDDAMTAFVEAQHQRGEIENAVRDDRLALQAADRRYRDGVVDLLNVISVQTALIQNEDAMARSETALRVDLVDLYKALGGGWQATGAPTDAPPPPSAGPLP